jgi:hypothetical protein
MGRSICNWTLSRLAICCTLAGSLLVISQAIPSARADLLAYEGFDYAVGLELFSSNGGFGWDGAWADYGPDSALLIGSGSLPSGGVSTIGNHAFAVSEGTRFRASLRTLASPIRFTTHETVWISFLVSKTGGPSDAVGILDLWNGNRHLLGIGDVQFGDSEPGNWGLEAAGVRTVSDILADDTARLLVTQLDLIGRQAHLWIDPDINGGNAPLIDTANVSIVYRGVGFDEVEIWIEGGGYRFDELRIATTFASAVAVPESSSWLLMAVAVSIAVTMNRWRTTFLRGGF